MEALKLSCGIDVSKADFHTSLVVLFKDQSIKVIRSRKFANTSKGIADYMYWYRQATKKYDLQVHHVMEATGVYHENLALQLFKSEEKVSIVLPNKAKKYIQSLGFKTKNDQVDAKALAFMGAQQKLDLWQPMGDYFYRLRTMTRTYQSYQESITALSNQIEALSHGMYKSMDIIKDLKSLIKRYEQLKVKLVGQIEEHFASNQQINTKVEGICKIKGVSMITVAVLLAETNGFVLFKNYRQLVSYSGYDVVENQSGNRKGKTKISKQGNSRIRRALLMPSFCVVKYEERFQRFFENLMTRKEKKMVGYVAVQKKLLVIIYSLWKNNQDYDPHYLNKENTTGNNEQVFSSRLFSKKTQIALSFGNAIQGIQPSKKSQYVSSR